MSYAIVGSCPKCGAPVYAESPWWGIFPPPSRPSCTCNPQAQTMTTTTTAGRITINDGDPIVTPEEHDHE